MGSSASEIKKALKKYGWELKKTGSKHYVYSNGITTLTIPYGRKIYSRSYKEILMQIQNKTLYQRNQLQTVFTCNQYND